MNRRQFMRTMFGTAVTVAVNPGFVLTPKLAIHKLGLHGIPYHEHQATVGTWMGIKRSTTPAWKASYHGSGTSLETLEAIKKMIDKAMEHYERELYGFKVETK